MGRASTTAVDTAIARPARRAMRTREPGLDLICTKVAVDFQSITHSTAEERINAGLQSLTDACGADSVFVALLDDVESAFDKVYLGRSTFSACNPEVLKSRDAQRVPVDQEPARAFASARDSRYRESADRAEPRRRASREIERRRATRRRLQHPRSSPRLLGVVSATPSPDWGADLHLALKLVSVSVASGLERIELLEDLFTVQERDRLVTQTANDGLWDYDVRDNSMYFSPRWRAMLGYADERAKFAGVAVARASRTISRTCRTSSASI